MVSDATIGTYILTHLPSGKFYVGSASNLSTRRSTHKHHLLNGSHKNANLQAVFTCWEDMLWESFLYSTRDEAYDEEQRLLNCFLSDPNCCNYANDARTVWGVGGMPEHRREHISQLKTGNTNMLGKTHSAETRQKMSDTHRGLDKSWLVGRTLSEETREKLSKARKGIAQRPKGFNHSEETKRRMSEAQTLANASPERRDKSRAAKAAKTKKVSIDGVVYDGVKEAARQLGMWPAGVSTRCHSTDVKYKDWFFVPITV